jgi:hypothetical protein
VLGEVEENVVVLNDALIGDSKVSPLYKHSDLVEISVAGAEEL